jgi:(R)-2-hydroxyacyl-CoA dehydratese activating ATPase
MGIDLGSRNTKLVLINLTSNSVAYSACSDTGVNPIMTVESMLSAACSALQINRNDILKTYTTGYGRNLIPSSKVVSEIRCHALGVLSVFPEVRSIIDIGGQDCKAISLGDHGKVLDFVMNDKCAAGTGRFLEMVALRLGLPCEKLSSLASEASEELTLSSTCVVFAESEIIGLIAQGRKPADIVRAVHLSIAERIVAQINQLDWKTPVVFTGGVALNNDLRQILANKLNCEIVVPPEPELTGALGAALIALRDDAKK